jgi:hypothetical protein
LYYVAGSSLKNAGGDSFLEAVKAVSDSALAVTEGKGAVQVGGGGSWRTDPEVGRWVFLEDG